nr:DUF3299 domain-containing protein [Roseibium litorale]
MQVAGVDIDGLLSQREDVARKKAAASLAANPALENETVKLKGFVIPLFNEAGKDLGGYFVPEAGMCSHLPPPPPNQMIYYPPGSGWEGAYVYQSAELQGRLKRELARQEISLLDGRVEMISAWVMAVDSATALDEPEDTPQQRSFSLFSRMKQYLTNGGTSEPQQ